MNDDSDNGKWRRLADPESLAQYTAQWLCARTKGVAGPVAICLSGGSTPRRLYQLLAMPPLRDEMPWDRLHFFLGDERFVPPDHPDSNFRMVREALFDHVPVAPDHIHPVPTQRLTPEAAAEAYARALQDHYGGTLLDPRRPLFDVTFLGLGEDGHTASLFPDNPALAETKRWVVAVRGAREQDRITLTYPVLDSSADAVFLVAGEGKRAILARVRAGGGALPAARVRPVGCLHWFADAAAWPD